MWRPKSLLEALQAGEPIAIKQGERGRYICPNCGVIRPAAVMIDVRHLPIPEEWACDACWTHWKRTKRVVDGGLDLALGDARARRMEWLRRWAIAHGAPAAIVQKFTSP